MYQILLHPLVLKVDFKKIPKGDVRKIIQTINKKLRFQPEIFGKPLTGELRGYYRLRFDPYRIVYRIEKAKITVFVIHVGLRKDFLVYIEAARRLGFFK